MNTKIYVIIFKLVLFLVNYHESYVTKDYFVFIEFQYYMKLFTWMMKTSWLECVLVVSLICWHFHFQYVPD